MLAVSTKKRKYKNTISKSKEKQFANFAHHIYEDHARGLLDMKAGHRARCLPEFVI